jgi:hypothetical protein
VCADQACHEAAMTKGALRRALAVPIPAGLFDPPRVVGAAAALMQNQDDQEGGA